MHSRPMINVGNKNIVNAHNRVEPSILKNFNVLGNGHADMSVCNTVTAAPSGSKVLLQKK